jgi:hypothetical protein
MGTLWGREAVTATAISPVLLAVDVSTKEELRAPTVTVKKSPLVAKWRSCRNMPFASISQSWCGAALVALLRCNRGHGVEGEC